ASVCRDLCDHPEYKRHQTARHYRNHSREKNILQPLQVRHRAHANAERHHFSCSHRPTLNLSQVLGMNRSTIVRLQKVSRVAAAGCGALHFEALRTAARLSSGTSRLNPCALRTDRIDSASCLVGDRSTV